MARRRERSEEADIEEPRLPRSDYHLDESDPDVVVGLRCQDGVLVAAFSAGEITREGLPEATEDD